MADILTILGENVRTERVRQGLSQEELADKAGFHRTYIGMIERAERNITLRNLERLAEALEVSIADLITIKP
jgi:transcriptional regulator with XRE-family HTH domain